jgi:hypothetical protein
MNDIEIRRFTIKEHNETRLTSNEILSGQELRRKRRKEENRKK